MPQTLRPINTIEILDAAWVLLRRQWALYYAVSSIGTLPVLVLALLYFRWTGTLFEGSSRADFARGTLLWATGMAIAWAVNSLCRGTILLLALADAGGEPRSLGDAWRAVLRAAPSVMLAGLLPFAASFVCANILSVPTAFLYALIPWYVAFILTLVLTLPGWIPMSAWWVARAAALDEDQPYTKALGRSRALTAGYRMRAVALWGLLALLAFGFFVNLFLAVRWALTNTFTALGIDTAQLATMLSPSNQVYIAFLMALVFVLIDPVRAIADAVFYLDLRVRREGADLETRLRAARAVLPAILLLCLLGLARPVDAATPAAYRERIQALRKELETAKSPADVERLRISELRNQVVEIGGGQKVDVNNQWLQDGFEAWTKGEKSGKESLLNRLDALERSLGAQSDRADGSELVRQTPHEKAAPGPSAALNDDPNPTIRSLLQEPEFQRLSERKELQELIPVNELSKQRDAWWKQFWNWFQKTLLKPPKWNMPKLPNMPSPQFPTIPSFQLNAIVWVLIALVAGALILLFVKWLMERPGEGAMGGVARTAAAPPPLEASATENALDHTVDEWELFAREWIKRGDFRQAIRALYLASLVHLHRERKIDYNRAQTNWTYVRTFKGDTDAKGTLRHLTGLFDEVWYGERPCAEEQYRQFESGVRALGTPAPVVGGACG